MSEEEKNAQNDDHVHNKHHDKKEHHGHKEHTDKNEHTDKKEHHEHKSHEHKSHEHKSHEHKAHHDKGEHHKKAHPEKHVHHVHKTSSKKNKRSNNGFFAFTTIILGILFIASLMTNGFSGNDADAIISDLNEMKEKNPDLSTDVDAAIVSLENIKEKTEVVETKTTMKEKSPSSSTATPNEGAVEVEFYVMSQCPYGTQVEDAIAPVLDKLGDDVDFKLEFIATETSPGVFDALHGQTEVDGNIVQLCAMKYNPDSYMDMIVCQNENAGAIPGNWESCAEENGLDVDSIRTCYEGDEGKELLSKSAKRASDIGATGSPTIYIDGARYNGGRSEADFFRAICQAYGSDASEACSDIPEPVAVNLKVITDERCAECNPTSLISQLTGIFPGLVYEVLDYSDAEGKALYEETGIEFLPAFLFDETVEEGEGYANVQSYLEPVGDYQSLRIGAAFDPEAEICGNGIDDDGNGQVDCEDPACDGEWQCMEKLEKPVVEMFVMSHCPYGTQIEKGALPVIDLLEDKVDWNVKFVYYVMHGEEEVQEQLLQYCIQEERKDIYFDYLECFLEAGDTESCLADVGLTMAEMQSCMDAADAEFEITKNFEDESLWLNGRFPLFNTDKEANEKYGIAGSPGFAINGVNVEGQGRDPASILETVCTGFTNPPAECDETLSSAQYNPGFGFEQASPSAAPTTAQC